MLSNLFLAIEATLLAGEKILKIYNKDFNIEYKDDKSPLTEADIASNEIIVKKLQETNIPIISEENKTVDYETRKNWSQCWIVDPIDGTKEFIKKNGEFTVNIALVENGKTKLGVIYVPVSKELYYTNESKTKAYKTIITSLDLKVDSLLFKSEDEINKAESNTSEIKVVGSRSHMNEDTLQFVESLKTEGNNVEIVSKGSSLKFCLVAEGKADVYPRFAPTMEWDTAAGQAICEAVGLTVIDQSTKKPMLYNRQNLLNSYFLVTK
ncbi:3'(2'),5'-bisphosphate nucleotidase CysQ [Neotamlana laminarinivorans]|uniref:3'(2'),5'-bisphosphate nucleotidase CysQ n=1 Tax=Neotamlana laminarinivorans TaxID=2883124 RepID=A0A9X1I184_9FLAO|nr:3'(2'),5'-bisphosphate nucleotidase CysQ [Tamlana laminarinivorans]MCB4798317.1 3'(2'),5'-bisphosphate nucleotidase CysQ [Tamlana laminarinivorans]